MTRRTSYLIHLINLIHGASPQTPSEVETLVAAGITELAKTTGRKRSIIRRDTVRQNGYRGSGSQALLCADLWSALQGEQAPLVSRLRSGDHEAVLAHITSLAPAPLTSSEWLEKQVRDRALDRRLAALLKRDYPSEDYAECLSLAGLWIAKWAVSGAFDKALSERGTVSVGTLYKFLKRKHFSSVFVRGAEPLARMRGARTQHEIRVRVETGASEYVCQRANQATDWEVAYEGSDEDLQEIIISPTPNPEEVLLMSDEETTEINGGRALIRAGHRGAADRYQRVFDALIGGATRDEIALKEGVSVLRASHLAGRVRKTLREGPVTVGNAQRILRLVAEEPWSTRDEIQADLRLDAVETRRALAYLCEQGILDEATGESYAVVKSLR